MNIFIKVFAPDKFIDGDFAVDAPYGRPQGVGYRCSARLPVEDVAIVNAGESYRRVPPKLYRKAPAECSPAERAEFAALVCKGGEVNSKWLDARISLAAQLVFLNEDTNLLGIAAIKNPLSGYRISVSKNPGVALRPAQFPYELGWVFVEEDARGKGYSHALVICALRPLAGAGVFATSRDDNVPSPLHRAMTIKATRFGQR